MMFALIITICLSDGAYVECKEYRAEPFDSWYLCKQELTRIEAELKNTKHEYMRLKCVGGKYS